MKTIWKFILPMEGSLAMPAGALVLHVHAQQGEICLWARVDPDVEREMRSFRVFGTGHPMPNEPLAYLGTAHLQDGQLVLHVYEKLRT